MKHEPKTDPVASQPATFSPRDFEAAACELLRAIRGKRSQLAFSRRLGYRANPTTNWERGVRHPTIREALRAAEVAGLDVPGAFARFSPLAAPDLSGENNPLHEWLNSLRGSTPIQTLAAQLGCSRHTVGRWLAGRAQPRLHEFLQLLEISTGRAHDWVAELVDIDKVPSLLPAFRRAAAARTIALEQPWTEAILRVLETTRYHEAPLAVLKTLAPCLGITDLELSAALDGLVAAGIVERQGDRYLAVRELSVKSERAALRRLHAHWLGVAKERVVQGNDGDWFGYNVISVSERDLRRIHECMKRAYVESRAIVAASQPSEAAALVLMHLVKW